MAHDENVMKPDELEREQVVALNEKPTPVTVTNVPTPPFVGFKTMKGAVTVKVVWTESPVEPYAELCMAREPRYLRQTVL